MQNNDPALAFQPDDEISLLDILAVLSENLKLLVIGPIVAGEIKSKTSLPYTINKEGLVLYAA